MYGLLLFYQQFLARVCLTKWGQHVWTGKVSQISGVTLAAEPSIKSCTFIFLGLFLYFKPASKIKKFRTPHDGYLCYYEIRK